MITHLCKTSRMALSPSRPIARPGGDLHVRASRDLLAPGDPLLLACMTNEQLDCRDGRVFENG